MFSNARKFYVENVLPSYEDFIKHRESNDWGENQLLRKGVNAASALFHLREHIPSNIQPSKNALRNQYPDYGLIGDIANVSKHHEISRDNPQISNASQIYENLRLIVFSDEEGEYTTSQLEIYVKLDNGTELKLINILHSVMGMWCDVLDSLGIINPERPRPLEIDKPISRKEADTRRANMQIRKGEDYNFGFRMEKYNYEKNIIEPMDITGMNLIWQIKKLPENAPIHVNITNPKIGVNVNIDFDIPLSEDQAAQYILLSKAEEKEKFLKEIMFSTPGIKQDFQSKIETAIRSQITNRT